MTDEVAGDEIGPWSEVKLDIVRDYAAAYSRILTAQRNPELKHVYIDGFAGGGTHRSRSTGGMVAGSPTNALLLNPPFREYHFVDLRDARVQALEEMQSERNDVWVYHGNCNDVLVDQVFPRAKWEDYRRALCLLDPYGMELEWRVIAAAGAMGSVELIVNFPVMAINREVPLGVSLDSVSPEGGAKMDRLWGDGSWREVAYPPQPGLFGDVRESAGYRALATAFRKRLREVAGFSYVPEPVLMLNRNNAPLYYLFFASPKAVAKDIVEAIFNKYRQAGAVR